MEVTSLAKAEIENLETSNAMEPAVLHIVCDRGRWVVQSGPMGNPQYKVDGKALPGPVDRGQLVVHGSHR